MPQRHLQLTGPAVDSVGPALQELRTELGIRQEFSEQAQAQAHTAATAPPRHEVDATDVELVTIDPPGAQDLDQAMHLAREGEGYCVQYAIADPASFVTTGSELDREIHERGMTFYGPDGRIGLHPAVLSEDAASLLPGAERPAFLWRLHLDATAELTEVEVVRAQVRSRAKLSYAQVQRALDGAADPDVPAMLGLLREIGMKRQHLELERGGASLRIPEQEIVQVDGHYELCHRSNLDVEEWNAQISLLTGMAAATLMRRKRVGVLRTLPEADPRDVRRLRRAATGLKIDWPQDQPYGEMLHGLDAARPAHAAFFNQATALFRGAGYLTFDGDLPPSSPHGAIAAEYAHVTAPLRRLVDRYGLEICLAASAGTEVPAWVREGLDPLPKIMASTGQRASGYERECINLVEALLLRDHVGDQFEGVVVDVDDPDDGDQRGDVVIAEPAVEARVTGRDLPLGTTTQVTLTEADPKRRQVHFHHP